MKNMPFEWSDFISRLTEFNKIKNARKSKDNNNEINRIKAIQASILKNLQDRNNQRPLEMAAGGGYNMVSNARFPATTANSTYTPPPATAPAIPELPDKPTVPEPTTAPADNSKDELKRNISADDEWKSKAGAFYMKGLNNIDDLGQYDVNDAPKGWKWVPVENPNYYGEFRDTEDRQGLVKWIDVVDAILRPGSADSLVKDNKKSTSEYAYRWALQKVDAEGNPTDNTSSQIVESNTDTPIAPPPAGAPSSNTSTSDNNSMVPYGAPVPIPGTLPPTNNAPMVPTFSNSVPNNEPARMQGNAAQGTLGSMPAAVQSGSIKQSALYGLFGTPSQGNTSSKQFIF